MHVDYLNSKHRYISYQIHTHMCMHEHHQILMVLICKTFEMIEGIMFMNMFNI
jgi:hypothetical protein